MKAAIDNEAVAIGAFVSLGGFTAAALIARAGFDFLIVDLQHEPFTIHDVADVVTATSGTACACLVRTRPHDYSGIEAVLDAGADGIIAPMVRSGTDAARTVAACHYPPAGRRSVGGTRARLLHGDDYFVEASGTTVCIVQIEDSAGLEAVDEIVRTDGVDAVFAGPVDLSRSMGYSVGYGALKTTPDRVLTALSQIAATCKRHRRAQMSVTSTREAVAEAVASGVSLFIAGGDAALLEVAARRTVREARAGAESAGARLSG